MNTNRVVSDGERFSDTDSHSAHTGPLQSLHCLVEWSVLQRNLIHEKKSVAWHEAAIACCYSIVNQASYDYNRLCRIQRILQYTTLLIFCPFYVILKQTEFTNLEMFPANMNYVVLQQLHLAYNTCTCSCVLIGDHEIVNTDWYYTQFTKTNIKPIPDSRVYWSRDQQHLSLTL